MLSRQVSLENIRFRTTHIYQPVYILCIVGRVVKIAQRARLRPYLTGGSAPGKTIDSILNQKSCQERGFDAYQEELSMLGGRGARVPSLQEKYVDPSTQLSVG